MRINSPLPSCRALDNQVPKLILSIDGGGALGIGPAAFLAQYELHHGHNKLCEDALAGTSVGSAIVAPRACGYVFEEIEASFAQQAPRIFQTPKWTWRFDPRKPKYDGVGLAKAVKHMVGLRKMNQLGIPLWIVAIDYKTGKPKVYDTSDGIPVWEAVANSCSAPTYFPPRDGMSDGGVIANSPAMTAVAAAVSKEGWSLEDIHVLSMGTNGQFWKDPKVTENTNKLQWGGILLDNITKGNEALAEFQCRTILQGRHCRIEPILRHDYGLDDVKGMAEYAQIWKGLYTTEHGRLLEFLEGVRK